MDPLSKGNYSRHIREASMAMEGLPEVVRPSGRVPGQLLLAAPILTRQRRRYREEFKNKRLILGVSSAGAKYRPRGAPRGAHQGPRRVPGVPSPLAAPRGRLGPWWWPYGPTLVIREASVTLIFYIILLEFLEHFLWLENLKYKKAENKNWQLGALS